MKNKKILISIIIVLIILLICGGVFAYIYFATDLLKSDYELFSKNMKIASDSITEFFKDDNMKNYLNKKQTMPYENSGKINAKVESDYSSIDVNLISFTGAVDNANKKVEQKFKINYSDTVSLPVEYVQDGDKYAIGSEEIVTKYLTIENNNLKQFATNLGIDSTDIPDKIEISEAQSTNYSVIMQRYFETIKDNLTEENFFKDTSSEQAIYSVKIEGEQLKNLEKQLLNQLKNDEEIIQMTGMEKEEYQTNIDDSMKEVDSQDYASKYIQLSVYEAVNNVSKIVIDTDLMKVELASTTNQFAMRLIDKDTEETQLTQMDISVEKTATNDSSKYVISATIQGDEAITLSMTIELTGLSTNNVTESYDINAKVENETVEGKFTNTIAFKDSVTTTTLTSDNAEILNTYSEEDLAELLQALVMQIFTVNNQKLEAAGASNSGLSGLM